MDDFAGVSVGPVCVCVCNNIVYTHYLSHRISDVIKMYKLYK